MQRVLLREQGDRMSDDISEEYTVGWNLAMLGKKLPPDASEEVAEGYTDAINNKEEDTSPCIEERRFKNGWDIAREGEEIEDERCPEVKRGFSAYNQENGNISSKGTGKSFGRFLASIITGDKK